jgi:DNA polymerase-3 subunit gamma/tau
MADELYLKYRPQSFDKVVGHRAEVRSFQAALDDRLNKAFLLSGPSGVGKTTLARIASTYLGADPDDPLAIQEIDAATYTGIDAMRTVMDGLRYRPLSSSKIKSLIVDECHRLSKNAWDSLLKTLEEPPEWVYWFLCTTDPGSVPKTVYTRCTSYTLKPLRWDVILDDILLPIVQAEKLRTPDDILEICAREAQGSPRQAISNLSVCAQAETRKEAAELLRAAGETPEAIELARMLVKGTSWARVQPLLDEMKDQNPESIRQVVRAYLTTAILGTENEGTAADGFSLLEHFSQPFPPNDGITPVLLAVGRILFAR